MLSRGNNTVFLMGVGIKLVFDFRSKNEETINHYSIFDVIVIRKYYIPSLELCPYGRLDQVIRLEVNCCSSFIQNQDLAITYLIFTWFHSPTFVFLRRALARQINCLWPTLRFSPPSDTSCCNTISENCQHFWEILHQVHKLLNG